MKTTVIKNKPLSNNAYKKMEGSKLIELFNPMIKNLLNRFSEPYYQDDMRQDLCMELLKLQKKYKSTKGGPRFPSFIKMFMLNAAAESKMRNAHSIYTPPSTIRKMRKEEREIEIPSVVEIPEESLHINYHNLYTIRTDKKESHLFSTLKIILQKIRDSDLIDEEKLNLKEYIRNFLETNRDKKLLNKKLKKLLKDTILGYKFNK
jgi:hypothetical protein